MALDKFAGQKRSVSFSRNLQKISDTGAADNTQENSLTASSSAAVVANNSFQAQTQSNVGIGATSAQNFQIKPTAKQNGRTKKISFFISPELEARFRSARLQGGFEKLEDAYNAALEAFVNKHSR